MAIVERSDSDVMHNALHCSAVHQINSKNCVFTPTAIEYNSNLQGHDDGYFKKRNALLNYNTQETLRSVDSSDFSNDSVSSNSYSSSISSQSERSEEYVPLTCTLVKTFPQRRCIHCPEHDIENDLKSSDDESESSLNNSSCDSQENESEAPISAIVEYMDVDRQCGEIEKFKYANFTTYPFVNEPSPAEPSLIAKLSISHVNKHLKDVREREQKVMSAVQDKSEESFCTESDTVIVDIAQVQLIVDIVKRLHMNANDVTLEMLENVNWGEENYQAALEPLRKIYCELESKARELQNVPTFVIEQVNRKYAKRISELVRHLPSSEAFETKLLNLANHPITSAKMSPYLPLNANMVEDQMRKSKVRFVNEPHDKACMRGAHHHDVLSDNRGESLVLESEMSSCMVGTASAKEQIMRTKHDKVKMRESVEKESEHAIRRHRESKRRLTTKTSFSEVPILEEADSIVEPECELAGVTAHVAQGVRAARESSKSPKSKGRRRLSTSPKHRKHVKLLVDVAPENEDADAVVETNTDYIGTNTDKKALPAILSNLRDTEKSNGVSVIPNSVLTYTNNHSGTGENKEINNTNLKLTKKPSTKHRRERLNRSIRSCEFTELEIDEAGEVPDGDESLKTNKAKQVPESRIREKTRNSKNSYYSVTPCTNGHANKATENKASSLEGTKRKSRKLRNKLHRSREISISQLEDEKAGEIYEDDLEMSINDDAASVTNKLSNISKFNDGRENASNFTIRRNFTGPRSHSSLHSVSLTINSDLTTMLDEAPSSSNYLESKSVSKNPSKRHRRMRVSRELSISQIPDEIAGEIEEKDTETLNSSDNISVSAHEKTRNRVFPKQVIRIQRVGDVDKQVISDNTPPHLPSLVRSTKRASNTETNKAVPKV